MAISCSCSIRLFISFVLFSWLIGTFIILASWGAFSKSWKSDNHFPGEADRVYGLPGQPQVSFRHYAGNIKLQQEDEKSFFYWYFEAEEGVYEKPLVLWLGFGPGCSSVAFGAAQEIGPFLVRVNQSQLLLNNHSWNKVANVLFVEAPIGVGFSYSNKSQDLMKLGDQMTAKDTYAFLVNWFKRFPMFKSNDFYIAGESYAGHFAPQLAEIIYHQNKLTSEINHINLRGFMVGNPFLNYETDANGMVDYSWSHGIISDKLYRILKACTREPLNNRTLKGCNLAMMQWFQALGKINAYSMYTPACLINQNIENPFFRRSLLQHDLWQKLHSTYNPCTAIYVSKYLNRADVQKALHANVTKLPYPYTHCRIFETWDRAPETVLPLISKLIRAGLRIWVYSGDTDAKMPFMSTRSSINAMHLNIKEEWREWYHNHQVGGWVVVYDGMTFLTVRGAGHFVPLIAPGEALSIVSHFLSDAPLPSSRF